jgi:hypothetical protein
MISRRIALFGKIRRAAVEAAGRLSDVVIIVTVDLAGAGIVLRPSPLLSELALVFRLDGL